MNNAVTVVDMKAWTYKHGPMSIGINAFAMQVSLVMSPAGCITIFFDMYTFIHVHVCLAHVIGCSG